jgi:hypothetical protein
MQPCRKYDDTKRYKAKSKKLAPACIFKGGTLAEKTPQTYANHARIHIDELTESQLVALRFASDAELPNLVANVLAHNMKSKEIKQAIVAWRADTFRV